MPIGTCEGIDVVENELSRNGAEYAAANGATIPNLGKRRCEVMTVGRLQPKTITFQVADVHKPLLSILAALTWGSTASAARMEDNSGIESLVRSSRWRGTAACTPCGCG